MAAGMRERAASRLYPDNGELAGQWYANIQLTCEDQNNPESPDYITESFVFTLRPATEQERLADVTAQYYGTVIGKETIEVTAARYGDDSFALSHVNNSAFTRKFLMTIRLPAESSSQFVTRYLLSGGVEVLTDEPCITNSNIKVYDIFGIVRLSNGL